MLKIHAIIIIAMVSIVYNSPHFNDNYDDYYDNDKGLPMRRSYYQSPAYNPKYPRHYSKPYQPTRYYKTKPKPKAGDPRSWELGVKGNIKNTNRFELNGQDDNLHVTYVGDAELSGEAFIKNDDTEDSNDEPPYQPPKLPKPEKIKKPKKIKKKPQKHLSARLERRTKKYRSLPFDD